MSDEKKPLGLRNSSGPGHVKQSFSHGRSKSVVVEKKRKRVIVPGKGGADASGGPRPAGVSDLELDRRKKALMAAAAQENDRKAREDAETKTREAERAERRRIRDEKERAEKERAEKARKTLEDKKKPTETPKKVKVEKTIPADDPAASQAAALKAEAGDRITPKRDDAPRKENKPQPRNQKGGDDRRRSGKLTINQALGGGGNRQRSLASIKRKQDRERSKMAAENMGEREKVVRDVQVPEAITVQELANRMAEKTGPPRCP